MHSSTLLSSLIQAILALMGIVSVILLFFAEQKLSTAIKILDELDRKYLESELSSIIVKRYLMLYVRKFDDIRLEPHFFNILATFFITSFFVIVVCILLLVDINNFNSLFISIFSILVILIFLRIVYYVGTAPYSDLFKKWSPESILKQPHYREFIGKYLGYFDKKDILDLYSSLKK